MSWLSSGLKKVGKIGEKVAPFVGMIPGVGTVAAAGIGGLSGLAAGHGLKGALKYGLQGAAGGLAGGVVKGALKSGGVLGGLKKVGGSVLGGSMPNADRDFGIAGNKPQVIGIGPGGFPIFAPQQSGGGIGGFVGGLLGGSDGKLSLGDVGGFLSGATKKIGGVDGLLGAGALGYGAYQQKQAGDMRDKALKLVTDDYNTRAPLRQMGLKGMLNETPPDLSATFAGTADNPFSRMRRVS